MSPVPRCPAAVILTSNVDGAGPGVNLACMGTDDHHGSHYGEATWGGVGKLSCSWSWVETHDAGAEREWPERMRDALTDSIAAPHDPALGPLPLIAGAGLWAALIIAARKVHKWV